MREVLLYRKNLRRNGALEFLLVKLMLCKAVTQTALLNSENVIVLS